MATPQAAIPRDLEQRIRTIEVALRQVASVTLRQRQLGVSEGDFVVSGGGGILVRDGGNITGTYPDNSVAFVLGATDETGWDYARGIRIQDPAGSDLFEIHYLGKNDGSGDHFSTALITTDDVFVDSTGAIQLQARDRLAVYVGGFDGAQSSFHMDLDGFRMHGGPLTIDATGTGASPNAYLDANGQIYRNTSSRRYKENIRDLTVDPGTALRLTPVLYTRKDEAAQETPRVYVGFIAEDADELGLSEWVEYDAEGNPESFSYALWPVALQAVCRAQQQQIDTQAQQIANLTARLDALEKQVSA